MLSLRNLYKIGKRLFHILSVILIAASCEKMDPFEETDKGNNVLGFFLDGEKVSYTTSGGFPSSYPYEHCVYTRQINADSLEIYAQLNSSSFPGITIKIAIAQISTEHGITNPNIALEYLYKKTPLPPCLYSEVGTHYEYLYTELVCGNLSFRTWNQAEGILSGNFNFDCDMLEYNGSVKRISVTKGNFDVKLDYKDYE